MSRGITAPLGPGDQDPILLRARAGFRQLPEEDEHEQLFEAHNTATAEVEDVLDKFGIEPDTTYGLTLTTPIEYIDADGRRSHLLIIRDANEVSIKLLALIRGRPKLEEFTVFSIPTRNVRSGNLSIIRNSNNQVANQAEINWLRIIIRRMSDAHKASITD